MNIKQALEELSMSKGELMQFCFGKNYVGIDSAIPQQSVDDLDLIPYYWATDCRKLPYRLINLCASLPEKTQQAIIGKAIVHQWYMQQEVPFSAIHAINEYWSDMITTAIQNTTADRELVYYS